MGNLGSVLNRATASVFPDSDSPIKTFSQSSPAVHNSAARTKCRIEGLGIKWRCSPIRPGCLRTRDDFGYFREMVVDSFCERKFNSRNVNSGRRSHHLFN